MNPSQMEAYLPKDNVSRAGFVVLGLSTFYILGLVIYRLIFSPIAKFPGPKLAAVSGWYELYYDVVHKGKYLFEIEKMHDKYGVCYGFLLSMVPPHQDCCACCKGTKLMIFKPCRTHCED